MTFFAVDCPAEYVSLVRETPSMPVVFAEKHLRTRVHTDSAHKLSREFRGPERRLRRAFQDECRLCRPPRQEPPARRGQCGDVPDDHRLQERADPVLETLHPPADADITHTGDGLVDLVSHAVEAQEVVSRILPAGTPTSGIVGQETTQPFGPCVRDRS